MELSGRSVIGNQLADSGPVTFKGIDPRSGKVLEPVFYQAAIPEVDRAAKLASEAQAEYGLCTGEKRSAFLREIGARLEEAADVLVERANAETALGETRLRGELARTVNQLRMFADLVSEGSWVDARIDRGDPGRKPAPKPDVRRMLTALGPVAVFGASNFPLAFSVAGGDTASALAAGCPVVVKAHPAHPGTSEIVGQAIRAAAEAHHLPAGVFSLLHGLAPELSLALVKHPAIRAVGFTGSLRAGRALFDAAAARPEPIPVFAEMGSVNPVFVLRKAAEARMDDIIGGLHSSFTLGVGQFCTNPGLVVALEPVAGSLYRGLAELVTSTEPGVMLHSGIAAAYEETLNKRSSMPGVEVVRGPNSDVGSCGTAAVLHCDAAAFLNDPTLAEEHFGPATLIVSAESPEQLLTVARALEGHLTATIQGEPAELGEYRELVRTLGSKVGRLLFNGYPTGVEVCPAMHHGGPYPATTDVRSTSVGTAAIERFARPICFQGFPQEALPPELRDSNPLGIWRLVDGSRSRS